MLLSHMLMKCQRSFCYCCLFAMVQPGVFPLFSLFLFRLRIWHIGLICAHAYFHHFTENRSTAKMRGAFESNMCAQLCRTQLRLRIGAQPNHSNLNLRTENVTFMRFHVILFFFLFLFISLRSLFMSIVFVRKIILVCCRQAVALHCAFSVKHCYHCCNASKYTIMSKKTPW